MQVYDSYFWWDEQMGSNVSKASSEHILDKWNCHSASAGSCQRDVWFLVHFGEQSRYGDMYA